MTNTGGTEQPPNPFSRPGSGEGQPSGAHPFDPQSGASGATPPAGEPPSAGSPSTPPPADQTGQAGSAGYPGGTPYGPSYGEQAGQPGSPGYPGGSPYGPSYGEQAGQPSPGYEAPPPSPSGYPAGSQPGYGYDPQSPTYGYDTPGTPGYPANPYEQPYEQQPYQAGGYPAYAGGGYGPPPPHPRAMTAMVLGIVGLVICPFVGIGGFVLGKRARTEIDAEPQRYGGRGVATAGYVLGIISIVYSALLVVYLVVVGIAAASGNFG